MPEEGGDGCAGLGWVGYFYTSLSTHILHLLLFLLIFFFGGNGPRGGREERGTPPGGGGGYIYILFFGGLFACDSACGYFLFFWLVCGLWGGGGMEKSDIYTCIYVCMILALVCLCVCAVICVMCVM